MSILTSHTPNPNAVKFILDQTLKTEGSSTYRNPSEADHNPLAFSLMTTMGVNSIHLRKNFVTVTKFDYKKWGDLEPKITSLLNTLIKRHDPSYVDPCDERTRRESLPPELLRIEEVLDRTIRGYLQADGGDMHTIRLEGYTLTVEFQGACGSCPAAQTTTLQAVIDTLRREYDPNILLSVKQ